jgi:Transglycosylase-like domain
MSQSDNFKARMAFIASLVSVMALAIGSAHPGLLASAQPSSSSLSPLTRSLKLQSTRYPARSLRDLGETARWANLQRMKKDWARSVPEGQRTHAPVAVVTVTTTHAAAIASCESGGRWDVNSGNGYWGGLQFAPSTWFAYGGGPFDGSGSFPYSAAQQIAVAEGVLAGQGPGAWPNCFQWK